MNEDIKKQWQNLLDPEILRTNLITASIYIAAYEILKDSIISRIKDFYSGWSENDDFNLSQDYKDQILSRNKSPLYASIDWLKEMEALSSEDIETFEQIKRLRNNLAHELPKYLSQGINHEFVETFSLMFNFLDKIETWWLINVEVPTNSEYEGVEVKEEDIFSGQVLLLQMMLEVALGPEGKASKYLEVFNQK